MQIITEQQVADILDPEKAFFAVQEVFASMESGAWNFPVVRESLGYQDALYGFKSGFDPASVEIERQGERAVINKEQTCP